MIKNKLNKLFIIILLLFTVMIYAFPVLANNTTTSGTYNFQEESGLKTTGNKGGFDIQNTTSFIDILSLIVNIVLSLVGLIFFAYLIYGAYLWMTSRGNDEKINAAHDDITNAIIGLIVVLAAYVVSYLLISYFR